MNYAQTLIHELSAGKVNPAGVEGSMRLQYSTLPGGDRRGAGVRAIVAGAPPRRRGQLRFRPGFRQVGSLEAAGHGRLG